MSPTPSLADYRERAIAALAPFFAAAPGGKPENARGIAGSTLDNYKSQSPKELQLAAQIIALGWTSLSCLSAAMVSRNESIDMMLDLQSKALKFNTAKEKATKTLDASRKERGKTSKAMTGNATKWDEGAFQLAINRALDVYMVTTATLKGHLATMPEPAKKQMPKLGLGFAQPMTPSVLARRGRP